MNAPLDLEARTSGDDHLSLRLWLRLLSCANLIESHARTRLRREFATTLPRFDLMAQLARARGGLTMGHLTRRLMVTGGNVTRLVDQLERDGLVRRGTTPADGRVSTVRLTPAGRRAFGAMATRHEGWIVDLFSGMTHAERARLYELLATLKRQAATAGEATR